MKPKLPLRPSQKKLLNYILVEQRQQVLFAGAANSGKTFSCALLMIGLANDFPKSRMGVFRKNLSNARNTVIPSYLEVLDLLNMEYIANLAQKPVIKLPNGSTIEFYELDQTKDRNWNKPRGLQLTAAHIDEANGVAESGKNILLTRINRQNQNGCPAFIVMTCNPSDGWVRSEFKDKYDSGTLDHPFGFIEVNADEVPQDYLDHLQTLPEAEYQRFVLNNWNYGNDPGQLIKYEWLKQVVCDIQPDSYTHIGLDAAWMGDDKNMLALRSDNILMEPIDLPYQSTVIVADKLLEIMAQHNIDPKNVTIDTVGVGAGVYDQARAKGYAVQKYSGAQKPRTRYSEVIVDGVTKKIKSPLQFRNRRGYDFWDLRELIRTGKINLNISQETIKDLLAIRYNVVDKYIEIEKKVEIKKRLGRSPDRADALVLALTESKSTFSYSL